MAYRETAQVKARKAAQREALLRTAETLVRDGGFAAMTMQTVADRAGVGVGTLYRYFDNKATLAAAVFAVATQREVDAVDRALAGGGDAAVRLERALRLFARRALAAQVLRSGVVQVGGAGFSTMQRRAGQPPGGQPRGGQPGDDGEHVTIEGEYKKEE